MSATATIKVKVIDVELTNKEDTPYAYALADLLGEKVLIDAYGQKAETLYNAKDKEIIVCSTMLGGSPKKLENEEYSLRHFETKSIEVLESDSNCDREKLEAELAVMKQKIELLSFDLNSNPKKITKANIAQKLQELSA